MDTANVLVSLSDGMTDDDDDGCEFFVRLVDDTDCFATTHNGFAAAAAPAVDDVAVMDCARIADAGIDRAMLLFQTLSGGGGAGTTTHV
jgi:hypothetical protein